MGNTITSPSFALVTLSYAPDFERCQLLVESVAWCLADNTPHYIFVDRRDMALFDGLKSPRTHIIAVEDVLPQWIGRMPGNSHGWASSRTAPINNWILQQLVKLSVCTCLDEDVVVFCDSDNTFVRPFTMRSRLLHDGYLGLCRVDFRNQDVMDWIDSAEWLLGLPQRSVSYTTYVTNLVAWRRNIALNLLDRIESIHDQPWIEAVCRRQTISEYMLYGIFVDYIIGTEPAGHKHHLIEHMKPSWGVTLHTPSQIDAFFAQLSQSHIGVMIHSKDNVPLTLYRNKIRSLWQASKR